MTDRLQAGEYTVLVVEDDLRDLEEVRSILTAIPNAVVLTCTTCEEARQLARRHRLQLAIIDLLLPDGSGLDLVREFTHEAESAGRAPAVCVVRTCSLYTSDPSDQSRGLDLG